MELPDIIKQLRFLWIPPFFNHFFSWICWYCLCIMACAFKIHFHKDKLISKMLMSIFTTEVKIPLKPKSFGRHKLPSPNAKFPALKN